MKASAEIRDEVLEELYSYYLGPGEFYGSDELLDRLCEAIIALAELEEGKGFAQGSGASGRGMGARSPRPAGSPE